MSDSTLTDLRLQLLANGYTPLPNTFKRPNLPGWQKVEVNEAEIRSWERMHGAHTTGIRLQDGLIAFDLDIDDASTVDLIDAIVEAFPELEQAVARTGSGQKEAWFLRCDELFNRIATPVYHDREDEEKGAMLEVFGGGSPRQFGAFGPHSENVDYGWVEGEVDYTPLNVPLAKLPMIPKTRVFEIVDFTTRWLDVQGFELLTREGAGESMAVREYVLNDEHRFAWKGDEDAIRCLEDLRSEHTTIPNASVSMSWLDGPVAKNTDRGLLSLDHHGGVCIHDTMTGISYHEERFKPLPPEGPEGLKDAMLALRDEAGVPAPAMTITVQDRASELLAQYAYHAASHTAIEIDNDNPQSGQIPWVGFKTQNTRWACRMADGDRPATAGTLVSPVDFWAASENLVQVDHMGYRPDKAYPLYEDERGKIIKNYFKRAAHDQPEEGSCAVFHDFIAGLLPDADDRAWAMDNMAYKARHPETPTPAVLLVDELGGVGKGVLFDILIKLMGARNAGLLPQGAVFGGSNMAQYKGDWAARVLHCIEELPSVSEATQKEQHNVYNRLKELVDPRPRTEIMAVKYGRPIEVHTCATYWMATNHVDAIPIPDNDRRIVVLNCGAPREREYYKGVAEWAADPANIAALYQWCCARDLSAFDNTYAPSTEAKNVMIETTRYGSEVAVRNWMEDAAGDTGGFPDFVTVQMVLADVRSLDPMAFVSQTGTRRVTSALRAIGYRDPMGPEGRRGLRIRVRRGGGAGEREHVLQHQSSGYVVGETTSVKHIKEYVDSIGGGAGSLRPAPDLAEMRRKLIAPVE